MRHGTTKRILWSTSVLKQERLKNALDQVALRMFRPLPQFNFLSPVNNAQFLGHAARAGHARAPAAVRGLLLMQGFNHRLLEPSARVSINCRVDRFVTHALAGIVGMPAMKSRSDLLRRPAPIDQVIVDMLIQRTASGTPCADAHNVRGACGTPPRPASRHSLVSSHRGYAPVRVKRGGAPGALKTRA